MNIIDELKKVRDDRQMREDVAAFRASEMAGIVRQIFEKVEALKDHYPLRFANVRTRQWSWRWPFRHYSPETVSLTPRWKTTLHFFVRVGADEVVHVLAKECHLYVSLRHNDGRDIQTEHVLTMGEAIRWLCLHFGKWELKK